MSLEFNLKAIADPDMIKTETSRFRQMIQERQAEIKLLRSAMEHYQKQCTHPGQKTGYNERDGSWANPCPVCGESH
jgi:hypothetical protein